MVTALFASLALALACSGVSVVEDDAIDPNTPAAGSSAAAAATGGSAGVSAGNLGVSGGQTSSGGTTSLGVTANAGDFAGGGGALEIGVVSCDSPKLDRGTHLIVCANGLVHRPRSYAVCPPAAAGGGAGAEDGGAAAIDEATSACAGAGGVPGFGTGTGLTHCSGDGGCAEGYACACGFSVCVAASCRSDADCGSGSFCEGGRDIGFPVFACSHPDDECLKDANCTSCADYRCGCTVKDGRHICGLHGE